MEARTRRVFVGCVIAGAYTGASVAACDSDPDPADWPNAFDYGVRDSAGITIVESRRPAPGSRLPWEVGTEPLMVIATHETGDGPQLYQVRNATRLSDGRTVVANGGSNELLVFDGNGDFAATWGRQGEGPGEFTDLNRVEPWPGDSVMAGDGEQGRVSVFDHQGNHGRTTAVRGRSTIGQLLSRITGGPGGPGPGSTEGLILLGTLSDGTLLTRNVEIYRTRGHWRQEFTYLLMKSDGEDGASLGEHPGSEFYSDSYSTGRGVMVTPVRYPFGTRTIPVAWGHLVALGFNATYEIKAYRSDGSLARIVRREQPNPGRPTQDQLDAHFAALWADRPADERRNLLEVAANVPVGESFPAYSNIKSDALGHLWVAEFQPPGEERNYTQWTVFDQDGQALGFVETPSGLTTYEIGADYILGKRTGELDIESVELWGLSR